MLYHYLKIALRNILKDRIYAMINVIGLSVAVVCCFLLVFWIKFELTFEACHPKAGRIYQVMEVEKRADGLYRNIYIRPGITQQLKETFPEIEASTAVGLERLSFVFEGGEGIMVDYVTTTPDYLDMFSYEYIEGSKESVLRHNGITRTDTVGKYIYESFTGSSGVIMSEETARKFFGNESAIGKTVGFGATLQCNVQAVVRIPQNTHVKFDILNPTIRRQDGLHYILVHEKSRFSDETKRRMADFPGTLRKTDNKLSFIPLNDIHLHAPKELVNHTDWQTFGDLKQIYLFSTVALLILVIAIINYVNTSTARAMNRMREVGLRKVSGSTQRQLILRFLSDAFIISAVSIVFAFVLLKWLFPEFAMMMGNRVTFFIDFYTILIALAVCLIITILAGGYAAFYLSSLNPITVLRGGVNPASKERLRKTLIGCQFFLSIGMLISTLVIYKQIRYMFTADTGVNRENVLVLDTSLWYQVEDFIQVIKRENPNIIDATIAWGAPYNAQYSFSGVSYEGSPDAVKEIEFSQIFCDYHYVDVFGLQLIDGEFIQPGWGWWGQGDDKSFSIVINETFKKLMGVDNPIGMTVTYSWGMKGKIIGVVKDFNFKPLKEPITPLIISFNPEASNKVYVKTTGFNKKETLEYIRKKYLEIGVPAQRTGRPFMYYTVEDDFNAMYQTELRTIKMLTVFSILSLCLCMMGIFSMVSFMVEKRKKEIAIRRINGAQTNDIIALFILDFAKIIGYASVMAIPVSWIILFQWLQVYAYRTALSAWIFAIVPVVVSMITAGIIGVQVFLTTRQNPAEVVSRE